MALSPALRDAPRYPMTSLVALAAVGISLLWWSGKDLGVLIPSTAGLARQPWILFSSALPHLDPIHLLFNLSWWWLFGTRIERAWGAAALLGITLVLSAGSAAAQLAFSSPAVGLSGVVYGLCGLLYVAQRTCPGLVGSVSPKTVQLFIAWFALCVALTIMDVWHVGNVAHAAGAGLGWGLGRCIAAPPNRRPLRAALVGAGLLAIFVAATIGRPWVNMSGLSSPQEYAGAQALTAGKPAEALPLLEAAVREQPRIGRTWANLGIAYQQLTRYDQAVEAYKRAISLSPGLRPNLAPSAASIRQHQAFDALGQGDYTRAAALAQEALGFNPTDAYTWELLGAVRARLVQTEGAIQAYERSRALTGQQERESAAYQEKFAENLSEIEMSAGQKDRAVARLREALKDLPQSGRLWLLLGRALESQGSKPAALEAYDRAAGFPAQEAEAKAAAEALRNTKE